MFCIKCKDRLKKRVCKREISIRKKITFGFTKLFILILLLIYLIIHVGIITSIYNVNKKEILHKRNVVIEEINSHIEEKIGKKMNGNEQWERAAERMTGFLLKNAYNSYLRLQIDDEIMFQNTDKLGVELPLDEKPNKIMVKVLDGKLYIMMNYVGEFTVKSGIEKGEKFTAYYQIIKDVEEEKEYFRLIFLLVGIADFIGIIMVFLLGNKLSKKLMIPINNIIDTAEKISINDLSERVEVSNAGDELTKLGNVVNDMIGRLEVSFEKQNKFVSDASHELRTPLSIMQGYVEIIDGWGKKDPVILDESIQSIKEEVYNMKNLIEKLLFLARGESSTIKLKKEDIEVKEFTERIVRGTEIISESHNILNTRIIDSKIYGDKDFLQQSLRALIENSLKYTKDDGEIIINSYAYGDYIVFEITDDGIGMKAEEKDKIFDRFYRIDESRTKDTGGSGLGLAIVKSIVELHNGLIEVQSEVNIGTTVKLFFPKINK